MLRSAMILHPLSRRSFLKASALLAATGCSTPSNLASAGPLIAYVGTFSSPLRDMLPTQVDLPPGNGRGIHRFQVDRATGALTPTGVIEILERRGFQVDQPQAKIKGNVHFEEYW